MPSKYHGLLPVYNNKLKRFNKNNFQLIKLSLLKALLQSSDGTDVHASFDLGSTRRRKQG